MPYKNFTAGSVFTAADANTYFMNQAVMTFTNEAARDAAITSPTEGMIAYLTAPTVPAATGASATYIPSGIKTIYNGSVWVCVTEVGAQSVVQANTSSTSYVTTLAGSPSDTTPISATLVTGTTALVSMTADAYMNNTSVYGYMSIAVSGATTLAANDNNSLAWYSTIFDSRNYSQTFILGGLTPGTNTFTLAYRVSANTFWHGKRRLWVKGIA